MNLEKLFNNKKYLKKEIDFFITRKHLKIILKNKELVESHLKKARHNIEFYKINRNFNDFNDWLIVILYYSLYHSALALITHKKYSSKNHYATILILIKEYSITKEEAKLLNELSINKEDAELYTQLKDDRHDASYQTDILFNNDKIKEYEDQVLDFINKAEELIK
jgi:uncharacterized protein (UPF0332 family)